VGGPPPLHVGVPDAESPHAPTAYLAICQPCGSHCGQGLRGRRTHALSTWAHELVWPGGSRHVEVCSPSRVEHRRPQLPQGPLEHRFNLRSRYTTGDERPSA